MCERLRATEVADVRATSLATLLSMVAGGIGITLLPAMAVDVEVTKRRRLVARPFVAPSPRRTIGLAWRKTSARGPEFQRLGEMMRG